MASKDIVVLGIVDPKRDAGRDTGRWRSWRPTVSLAQQPDFSVSRYELIFDPEHEALARALADDVSEVSPETSVRTHAVDFGDADDFEQVYARLHDFSRSTPFFVEEEEYLVHVSAGTSTQQACLYLLAESRHFPAKLVQTSPPRDSDYVASGSARIIDPRLAEHASVAVRLDADKADGRTLLKGGIETRNEAYNALIADAERVAGHSRAPILLTGPPGSGKTTLARRIVELARARHDWNGDVVELNCAALGADEQMARLFGDVSAAGTPLLDDALVFVDEVVSLEPRLQARLLDVLESDTGPTVVAATSDNIDAAVREGRLRRGLAAHLSCWSFELPSLTERRDDIEPNVDYELRRWSRVSGRVVEFHREARSTYLDFATSLNAAWKNNFRDLSASVSRLATLAADGRIDRDQVDAEIERLGRIWGDRSTGGADKAAYLRELMGDDAVDQLDRFDRVQLADVVHVCRQCDTLSEAGRRLFAISREQKKSNNDADRPSKYLAKFGIRFSDID